MSTKELERAVSQLSSAELDEFAVWFAEFQQEAWDRQIAEDSEAGRLDRFRLEANREFEAGLCRKL